jgi:hypothetical protein
MRWLGRSPAVLCALVGCGSSPSSPPITDAGGALLDAPVLDAPSSSDASVCEWTGTWSVQSPMTSGQCADAPPLPSQITIESDGDLLDGGSIGSTCESQLPPDPHSCQILGVVCEGWILEAHFFLSNESSAGMGVPGNGTVDTASGSCYVTFTLVPAT